MSLYELLLKAAGAPAGALVELLNKVKLVAPDLAGEVDKVLALLAQGVSVENLVSIASILPGEIANIAQGKIDPGGKKPADLA